MATITKNQKDPGVSLGATPWGNLTALRYLVETNATGAVIGSNSTAAVGIGDVVRLGLLPAGFRFVDSEVIVATGMTATITAKLGFAYADGVNDTDVPQDDDYFGAALNVATAARLRNATPNPSIPLPKEAWLTLITAEAANAKASKVEVVIYAIAEGVE